MNKIVNKLFNYIKDTVQKTLVFLDKHLIIPITKGIMFITDLLKGNKRKIEYVLNQKNSLIFLSLILSLILFFIVDNKANLFIESTAEVLYNQPVNAIYNEEAYVIEGLPETVDVTLIGRKSDLYLAKQLPIQEVNIDLSGLKPGTHKVSIRYKQPLASIDYKLDPSFTTVVIYPKISAVRNLTVDLLHQDDLDPRLFVEKTEISKSEVIIKGAQYKLDQVASVKALIDIEKLAKKEVGQTVLNDVPLIAYDESGNKIDVEIVPAKITATIVIASPSKTVPIKVVPVGNVSFGKAINSINMDKTQAIIYGDESALANINYIPIEINVEGLKENREFNMPIKKPVGVRYVSVSNVKINLSLDNEINREISNVRIEYRNLASNLSVQALSEADTQVSVILKGSEQVLNTLDVSGVHAYIDLSGYTVGEHEVDVVVYGDDLRITYMPKVKRVKLRIINQS
jgi:YbbR domain-containing protein